MKLACGWLYAINRYGYPPTIPQTLAALREMHALGFEAVELEGVRTENMRELAAHRGEVKQLADDLGLGVVNFCPVLPDLVSLDPAARQGALDLFKLGVELAVMFGCQTIQIDSFTPPLQFIGERPYGTSIKYGQHYQVQVDAGFDWHRVWDTLVLSVAACVTALERTGLTLVLEPRVGELVSTTDAMLRLLEAVPSAQFGAVLDTAHLHAQKEILPLSVEKLGRRVRYVHAADNDGRVNEHLAPGRGTVDWVGLLLTLRKHGYDDYIAIDVGGVPDLEAQVREGADFLRRTGAQIGVTVH